MPDRWKDLRSSGAGPANPLHCPAGDSCVLDLGNISPQTPNKSPSFPDLCRAYGQGYRSSRSVNTRTRLQDSADCIPLTACRADCVPPCDYPRRGSRAITQQTETTAPAVRRRGSHCRISPARCHIRASSSTRRTRRPPTVGNVDQDAEMKLFLCRCEPAFPQARGLASRHPIRARQWSGRLQRYTPTPSLRPIKKTGDVCCEWQAHTQLQTPVINRAGRWARGSAHCPERVGYLHKRKSSIVKATGGLRSRRRHNVRS